MREGGWRGLAGFEARRECAGRLGIEGVTERGSTLYSSTNLTLKIAVLDQGDTRIGMLCPQ